MSRVSKQCSVADCVAMALVKGFCGKHYQRVLKTGTTERRQTDALHECSIDGCNSSPRSTFAKYCEKHYMRMYRKGHPNTTIGQGWHDNKGYHISKAHGHRVASASGWVRTHRLLLFNKLGPGEHPCYHCGMLVSWDKTYPEHADALVVDHLDENTSNNSLDNIVPSCNVCNVTRSHYRTAEGIRRRYAFVNVGDKSYCVSEWAARLGISAPAMTFRLRNWSLDRALTERKGMTGPVTARVPNINAGTALATT
jgi:hypothetical protein